MNTNTSDEGSSSETNNDLINNALEEVSIDDIQIIRLINNGASTSSENNNIDSHTSQQNSTDSQNGYIESESNENEDKIILCLLWHSGKIAGAYFSLEDFMLYTLPEIWDNPPLFRVTETIIRQVQPSIILILNKITDTFAGMIKNIPIKKIEHLSKKTHLFESCKQRVLSLKLTDQHEDATEGEQNYYINSLIDLAQPLSTHTLGALLMYLDKNLSRFCYSTTSSTDNSSDVTEKKYRGLKIISLKKIVLIDDETFKALKIFSPKGHPSNFKKGYVASNKEGLSVFSLFKFCRTTIGSRKLREFFVTPTNDKNVLEDRFNAIFFFNKPKNENIIKNIYESLRYISNISWMLNKMVNMNASTNHWKTFYETIYHSLLINELLTPYCNEARIFLEISNAADETVYNVVKFIESVIDFQQSDKHMKIKTNVDLELDEKKQQYDNLRDFISAFTQKELQNLPLYVQECTIIYIPEIGYLLGLKKWSENITDEEINSVSRHLEFLFSLNDIIYYKSPICHTLDTEVGDIYINIILHEARITHRLANYCEKYFSKIQTLLNYIAELDCLLAMARVAYDQKFVRPILTNDREVDIVNGRHPLIELTCASFVPNTYKSNTERGFIKIISGANASGKSVYLKQIAIIIYMAHIGSYVPADYAKIPLLDNILTRIQTVESSSSNLSGFFIDLRQMSRIMHSSTAASLIIIDEFAKGTSDLDGVSLLAASIEDFSKVPGNCPHMLVATHQSQLPSLLEPTPLLSYQMMDHMIDPVQKSLVFLYKVIDGTVNSSCAIETAKAEGFPTKVIDRMKQVLVSVRQNESVPSVSLNADYKTNLDVFADKIISLDIDAVNAEDILKLIEELHL